MLVLAAGAACWNLRTGAVYGGPADVMWAHGGLLAARNIPIFVIAAAPLVPRRLAAVAAGRLPGLNVAGWLRAAATRFNRHGGRRPLKPKRSRAGTW